VSYSSLLLLLLLLLANRFASLHSTPSSHPPAYYTNLYRENNLRGGHVIKLGPGNDEAAKEALAAWPGESNPPGAATLLPAELADLRSLVTDALHLGGGITDSNALEWLDAGAEKVLRSPLPFRRASSDHAPTFDR
jgi:phosphoribosylformimino-5-aminoimidazole carboxamide ribotide isomerase